MICMLNLVIWQCGFKEGFKILILLTWCSNPAWYWISYLINVSKVELFRKVISNLNTDSTNKGFSQNLHFMIKEWNWWEVNQICLISVVLIFDTKRTNCVQYNFYDGKEVRQDMAFAKYVPETIFLFQFYASRV